MAWIRGRNLAVAAVVFALVYAVCTVLAIPGSILTLGAGFIFTQALSPVRGIAVASGTVFVGASLGAYCCFLLSRVILRDWASDFFRQYSILRAVERAIEKYPLRVMFLLRLSPVVPFNVLNYASGTLPLSHVSYVLAMLGMIPGTVVYCVVGSYLSGLSELAKGGGGPSGMGHESRRRHRRATVLKQVLWAVGVVATVVCLALITWYARQELSAQLEEEAREREEEAGAGAGAQGQGQGEGGGEGVVAARRIGEGGSKGQGMKGSSRGQDEGMGRQAWSAEGDSESEEDGA